VGIGKRVEKISYWGLLLGSVPSRRFDAIEEILMEAGIVVELGMESGSELVALACGNDVAINGGKCLAIVGGDRLDVRGTDEGHGYLLTNASDGACGVKTAQLTTVGITTYLDVHRVQTTFGEQDHTGTGAEDGHTVEDGLADRDEESEFVEEAHLDGTLSAREDKAVFRLLPVFQLAQLESLDSKVLKHLFMFDKGPL
jgi:hypothetical protein